MKHSRNICVIALVVGATLCAETRVATADNLVTTDKEIKINIPVLTNSIPVQLGSSLNTQYTADLTPDPSAGMLHLGTVTVEESIRYPSLFDDIYSGNSIGDKLLPSAKDGFSMLNPTSVYLSSWLTKQWASVTLSLSQTHLIERPDDQMAVGISKAVAVLHNTLFFNVGEYLLDDLNSRYWSRTTNLSMDYGWKRWDISMVVERRQDPNLSEHSVWATIKTKF